MKIIIDIDDGSYLDFICKAIENAPTFSARYDEGYSQGYIDGSTGAIRGMKKNE